MTHRHDDDDDDDDAAPEPLNLVYALELIPDETSVLTRYPMHESLISVYALELDHRKTARRRGGAASRPERTAAASAARRRGHRLCFT